MAAMAISGRSGEGWTMDFTAARTKMVDNQLRTENVTDYDVLAAMGAVPREQFLPPASRALAYIDSDLAVTAATPEAPARYMMEPAPLARLVQLAEVGTADVALVVGCGTGYAAAVLARLANSVVALEQDVELAAQASETLAELGVDNVAVVTGALEAGYPSEAPYDVVFVDGAVEVLPATLLDQLKDGGRLVAVVGYGRSAAATLFRRSGTEIGSRVAFDADVQPLPASGGRLVFYA
jgi:protein-L-isoaspartate(D-aspartate) O-methyltransferase